MDNVIDLDTLLTNLAKLASITLTPRQRFTYVPLPEDLAAKWTEVQAKVTPPDGEKQEIDHITLVFCGTSTDDIPPVEVDGIVKALTDVADDFAPIHAKVQGWAYFDGAKKDGKDITALVALVDAPGIEDLQVALKGALKAKGLKPSEDHAFTPHFTLCYLPSGHRVGNMPVLEGAFTIDKVCFANKDIHAIPLKGSISKAAAQKVAATRGFTLEEAIGRLQRT
jgi:2'-5' RNA ligase